MLKAYSTCVGAGPFAAENAMSESWNEQLRKAGGEYGAATGRPRRVGPFDCVASRYGLACQGADKIALTKLDVLSSMKEIPVITGYTLDGVQVPSFDPLSDLDRVEPVVTMLPGWNKDISGCRSWDELPHLDVLYMTRIQQERFFNEEEYLRLKGCYQLDEALLQKAPQDMPVLHPLPRIDEIKKDVDDDPRAAYFDQVHNGVYIRMAIILALLGIPDPLTGKKVLQR